MEGRLPLVSMSAIAWIIGTIVGLNRDKLFIGLIVIIAVILYNVLRLILSYIGIAITGKLIAVYRTISIMWECKILV
ncbi:hypothetical protein [Scytonema sp. NUACC26]|uniref:hypothetical protein n=1 Tax=Scytonema sp. NUACC26 TaxID=3140176 RepID=UPI0034DC181E